ncbi:NAD-dependent deacylase [Corynebacterium mendelii]|uniref:NAD-dependent protein deacylase n=1 Tax=Corynebacterium mendelii TaxID=2765362 RepID=A0A939IY83_9CORY|nr:NAD-dependent deacylase [Corynebacterium mendelii]MBN9644407.1 NAD-dependent deacylase [Corynebacterium mendelii]
MTSSTPSPVTVPDEVLDLARGRQRVVLFTGAGMSKESGIPVYRNDSTGLWENVNPEEMSSIAGWAKDPEPMWAFSLWRARVSLNAAPNAGHTAIARWNAIDGTDVSVITQNIDNLHERGGMEHPVHLHGSLFTFRCTICSKPARQPEIPHQPVERLTPPKCSLCGNYVRPGVVWFGEPLPHKEWEQAERLLTEADLVVIVGTSGVVQPACSLPLIAKDLGTVLVEITPAPTAYDTVVDYSWRATAATGLPALVDALGG